MTPRPPTFAPLGLTALLIALAPILQAQPGLAADGDQTPPPPLRLHPDNPRYFQFRGDVTVLVTSGEHYGALLNGAFDFETYFATLAADGFNLTRVFSGAYCEPVGAFRITRNTLAPDAGELVAPWARSEVDGYARGGAKFDLDRWNPDYFERLHALMQSASRHGIVVEFVFFCPFYKQDMWALSPLNPNNHIAPLPAPEDPNDLWTLDRSGPYLTQQERLVRKIVAELNRHDNLYYEVCNEPYTRDLPQDWHDHIAETIEAAQQSLPNRHLVSWNVANHGDGERTIVRDPHAAYSIFNFHYSNPPDEVDNNWHLGKPIGNNETGFDGQENRPYRTEAWELLLAGGSLFNHLDYSFAAAGHEDGSFDYPENQPGGGNATLRRQFAALKRQVESLDLVTAVPLPAEELITSGVPDGARVRVLADETPSWLVYLTDAGGTGPTSFELALPAGSFRISWIDPVSARDKCTVARIHDGAEPLRLESPGFPEDAAIWIVREDP